MVSVNAGLIGCGYWGPNLVRTLLDIPEVTLRVVADRDPQRLARIQARHPQVTRIVDDYRQMLTTNLDAVIVSTPPETHFEIVRDCLLHGLDVFVEKPLTTRASEARQLVEVAERTERVLMVGHIGPYNPGVRALKTLIGSGELGEIRYIDAVRGGLGLFHPRLGVMWDLAPHDIAIMLHLLGELPVGVNASAASCVQESVDDVAHVTLAFASGARGHARVSWMDPRKTRTVTVVGSLKMAVFDDLDADEKLKVYDRRVDAIRQPRKGDGFRFAYHHGDIESPHVEGDEPLRVECLHFIECVLARRQPLTDGRNGAAVVAVIEAAHQSLRAGGAQIPIGDGAHAGTRAARGLTSRATASDRGNGSAPGREARADHPVIVLPEPASALLAQGGSGSNRNAAGGRGADRMAQPGRSPRLRRPGR